MAQASTYYRPEWTCGKYNNSAQTAILYNLIEGMSHYFEAESANVIGEILSYGRNNPFSILQLSEATDIDSDTLTDFILQLIDLGLITTHKPSAEEIKIYREKVRIFKDEIIKGTKTLPLYNKKDEFELEGAEEAYANSINGWTNVILEMTYRCSAKCIHCYNIGSTHNPNDIDRRGERNELTYNEYIILIDQLIEQGMFKICLTGGDPFSSAYIWDILKYLYDREIAVEIYTNGISIVNEVDKLLSLYPRIVGISIYSSIPEVHDKITRINGSLQKSLDVMNQLYQAAVPLQLKCCVFRTNFDSYKSVYEIADKYCATPQIEVNVRNTVDGNKYVSQNLRLNDDAYEMLFKDYHIDPPINEDTLRKITPRDFNVGTCRAGITSCTITPEGNVIPCPTFHLVLGNIREKSLLEIRKSDVLKKWSTTTLKDYEECGTHDYCGLCAICAGENFADSMSYLSASENKCFMAKKRWNYAKKIYKG